MSETNLKIVHDDMHLYVTSEYFYVEPHDGTELLTIDRQRAEAKVQVKINQLDGLITSRRICGILGTIKLIAGHYLIVATHRLYVGIINNLVIWRLAGYDIIPYIPSTIHLTPIQATYNEIYLSMIRKNLETPFLYFSYSYDLTHTLQRLHSMSPEFLEVGLFDRADQRFVWNGHLLNNFKCKDMKNFFLPLVLGFVSINQANVRGFPFTWTIISRRSVQRAGTRLFVRGINEKGHCANYVETEQIVEFNLQKISFVQIRGSIPLYWHQTPNLRYKPKPVILPYKDHLVACTKHFDTQTLLYGRVVIINLVDQKGAEGELEKAFKELVAEMNNSGVVYEAFDFHEECKNMRWDRLNILIDRVAHFQDEFSFFHLREDGVLTASQDGIFRTNCIDCLDRTNVVQSMLAKRSLNQVFQKLGILGRNETFEYGSPSFEMLFKAIWADNADMISVQYSGTGALKTDFTRTGKRTKAGLLKDGVNSLTRYVLNNFYDGGRQDSVDLFLGHYVTKEEEGTTMKSPLSLTKGWRYSVLPSILFVATTMFFASVIFPSEYNTGNLLFLTFWGAIVGVTTSGIFKYGVEFVDWPRLIRLHNNISSVLNS